MTKYTATRLSEQLGVRYPIFLAGMGGISGPKLTAAVSNAGAMGIVGGLRLAPKALRSWLRETKALTDKPFGVNLIPQFGGPEVFDAQLRVVMEERPALLSLFYAEQYPQAISLAKSAGIAVMVQVGTVKLAELALEQGADIIVAQGSESGGHLNPGTIGLMSLLPRLVELAGGRPVLAAGGITDRQDVRVAMSMGAAGVLVGTAFVATDESNAHTIFKQRIVDAGTDDTEYRTGYSFGWTYGTPHRVIPNQERWNLMRFIGGGARIFDKPRVAQKLSLYAGQGVGRVRDVVPAEQRVAELVAGLPAQLASRA